MNRPETNDWDPKQKRKILIEGINQEIIRVIFLYTSIESDIFLPPMYCSFSLLASGENAGWKNA